jgi:hypothetical protein
MKAKTPKLDPIVFVRAAKRVAKSTNLYCCFSINVACGGVATYADSRKARLHDKAFKSWFFDDVSRWNGTWWSSDEAGQTAHIIALLLIAQLVREGAV